MGALRFRADSASPFLAVSTGKLPPLIRLPALLRAADAIHGETDTAEDLRFLLGAGSPLGAPGPNPPSAWPMAGSPWPSSPNRTTRGTLPPAKSSRSPLRRRPVSRVAEHQRAPVGGHSVSVITRFDRAGNARIPFISGASLLALGPDDPGAYTRLADAIRQYGHDVAGNLCELWRRLIFSLLICNHDDHLHNHGFLMREAGRWSLSPAYDLNPVPEIDRVRVNKTPISENPGEDGIAGALAVAGRFGLDESTAKIMLREIFTAVSGWRQTGTRLGLKAATLAAYASAFEHEVMAEAGHLLGK